MAFSFGFSGDDIDMDDSDVNNDFSDVPSQQTVGNPLPELVQANKHDMNEWVSSQLVPKSWAMVSGRVLYLQSSIVVYKLTSDHGILSDQRKSMQGNFQLHIAN